MNTRARHPPNKGRRIHGRKSNSGALSQGNVMSRPVSIPFRRVVLVSVTGGTAGFARTDVLLNPFDMGVVNNKIGVNFDYFRVRRLRITTVCPATVTSSISTVTGLFMALSYDPDPNSTVPSDIDEMANNSSFKMCNTAQKLSLQLNSKELIRGKPTKWWTCQDETEAQEILYQGRVSLGIQATGTFATFVVPIEIEGDVEYVSPNVPSTPKEMKILPNFFNSKSFTLDVPPKDFIDNPDCVIVDNHAPQISSSIPPPGLVEPSIPTHILRELALLASRK